MTKTAQQKNLYLKDNPFFKQFGSKEFEFLDNDYYLTEHQTPAGIKKVGVNDLRLYKFINELGYFGFEVNNRPKLVKVKNDKVIEEVSEREVVRQFHQLIKSKNFIYPYATNLEITQADHEKIINYFIRSESRLFSPNNLYRNLLPAKNFVEHTAHAAYIFYNDQAAQVTAQGIKAVNYADLPGYIWKGQIINRPIPQPNQPKGRNVWARFIEKISGKIDPAGNWSADPARFKHLKAALGYLMHDFYDGKRRGVLLIDSSLEDSDNGRTGKTLLGKGLINALGPGVVELNGKDFDTRDPKRYRLCALDTNLVILNDIRKGIPVDMFFNDITEGIQIHRNHEEPFNKNAKLLFTTNQSLKIDGPSAKDRFYPFELSQYFSEKLSPAQEFDCWFFSADWSAQDWAEFDLFMLECLQTWFANGFVKSESLVLEQKTILDHFGAEFKEYMEEITDIKQNVMIKPTPNKIFGKGTEPLNKVAPYHLELDKKECFDDFINKHGENGRYKYGNTRRPLELDTRTFYKWLRSYCDITKGILSSRSNKDKFGLEYKSNGAQYLIIGFE